MRDARDSSNINGHDPALPNEIAHGSKEQGGPPQVRSGLDDELRSQIMDELLVDPTVKGRLADRDTEPICLLQSAAVERKQMESRHRVFGRGKLASEPFRAPARLGIRHEAPVTLAPQKAVEQCAPRMAERFHQVWHAPQTSRRVCGS